MDEAPRPESPPAGPSRGPAWGPSLGLLAVAVGIVFGALAWWWTASGTPAPAAQAAPPAAAPLHGTTSAAAPIAAAPVVAAASSAPAALPPRPSPAATPAIPRTRDPNGDQTPDLSDYVNPGERPTMAHVIERLHQAGVYTGLGAFSPPGTRPPLLGLAVPEDFVLPDGYVRHHQATDDGQRIEAILMFAPDRQFFDAAGRPVEVPKDRVVPPELAPPGLPIRRVAVPPPTEPGRPGS
jgi:hypothetical protein